jgi:hypothetical protein
MHELAALVEAAQLRATDQFSCWYIAFLLKQLPPLKPGMAGSVGTLGYRCRLCGADSTTDMTIRVWPATLNSHDGAPETVGGGGGDGDSSER